MADYVNGKELTIALAQYAEDYKKAKKAGTELPVMCDTIAHGITQIAERIMTKHNFVNYSYRDEMASDAVMKCLIKAHLFNTKKSSNSFAYLSQICWNSAVERIKKEKHQTAVKAKLIREKMPNEFIEHGASIDDPDTNNAFVEFLKEHDVLVDHYAENKQNHKIHPSLVHRNKSAYPTPKQQVLKKAKDESVDIFEL